MKKSRPWRQQPVPVFAAISLLISGCGGHGIPTGTSNNDILEQRKATYSNVDRTDPKEVAVAWFLAEKARDYEAACEYTADIDRDTWPTCSAYASLFASNISAAADSVEKNTVYNVKSVDLVKSDNDSAQVDFVTTFEYIGTAQELKDAYGRSVDSYQSDGKSETSRSVYLRRCPSGALCRSLSGYSEQNWYTTP